METCFTSVCNNLAEIEKILEASFSMTSTYSNSKKVVKICAVCHEQDKRMNNID